MTFVLRIRENPSTVMAAVRRTVADADARAPVADVQMVEQYLARQIEEPRSYAVVLGAFGAVATMLAMFGIYGLIAYTAAQRAREIAIRMALGASTTPGPI